MLALIVYPDEENATIGRGWVHDFTYLYFIVVLFVDARLQALAPIRYAYNGLGTLALSALNVFFGCHSSVRYFPKVRKADGFAACINLAGQAKLCELFKRQRMLAASGVLATCLWLR